MKGVYDLNSLHIVETSVLVLYSGAIYCLTEGILHSMYLDHVGAVVIIFVCNFIVQVKYYVSLNFIVINYPNRFTIKLWNVSCIIYQY